VFKIIIQTTKEQTFFSVIKRKKRKKKLEINHKLRSYHLRWRMDGVGGGREKDSK